MWVEGTSFDCGSGFRTLTHSQSFLWDFTQRGDLRVAEACPHELKDKLAIKISSHQTYMLFRNTSLKSVWKQERCVRIKDKCSSMQTSNEIALKAVWAGIAPASWDGWSPSLPAQCLQRAHGLPALLPVLCTWPCSHLQGLQTSQQHPALRGPSGIEYACFLARRKNRQLEGIKNNSKKKLFGGQLKVEGKVRKRIKWSTASLMCLPSAQSLGIGNGYVKSWPCDWANAPPRRDTIKELTFTIYFLHPFKMFIMRV